MSPSAEFLAHAIDACRRIESYVERMDAAIFLGTPLVQDAVLRNFEVLGEAIARLRDEDPVLVATHADVPWRDSIAFRNRLIHGYASVDFEVVWATIQTDLPKLRQRLESIAKQSYGVASFARPSGDPTG
jgi:uncharacterized protein with HEPN domain